MLSSKENSRPSTVTATNSRCDPVLTCADPTCTTAQEVDKKTARKVVSDFFGRNKTQTSKKTTNSDRGIPLLVWHVVCRKTYQRSKYAADTAKDPKVHCNYYLNHLSNQLLRIKLWRPQATFTIQLQKSARERLNAYQSVLRRTHGDEAAAKRAVAVEPKVGRSGKPLALDLAHAVRMPHAEHIDEHFCGVARPLGFIIDTILPWIESEVESGRMERLPPLEFLLNEPHSGELVHDPSDNFARWLEHVGSVSNEDARSHSGDNSTAATAPAADRTHSSVSVKEPRPRKMVTLRISKLAMVKSIVSKPDLSITPAPDGVGEEVEDSDDDDDDDEDELGSPIMARGMVFAGAKPISKRKRSSCATIGSERGTQTDPESDDQRANKKIKA